VGSDGRPLAGQPVLVEPVPHRGWVDAKLLGVVVPGYRRVIARLVR
jgi:hypothetical protein